MKKIHILENTLRSVLLENRESKNINLARKLLKSHGYDDEQAQKTLDAIRTDIPNARLAQCKFLLGITRLFLNRELSHGNTEMKLNLYLPYIASNAYVNKYDNDLNGMSYYEIAEQFRPMYTQDAEKSRKNSYGKQHAVNNAYTIVRVPDFETASKYGKYTSWCITHSDYAYNSYTGGGSGLFYFCLRKGFERVPQNVGKNCPLDEYGLSMIAVSVTDEGEPNTITCRWNHSNKATDHVMSKGELEDLLGVNFYETFKPYTEEELIKKGHYTVSMLHKWISEGKDILRICKSEEINDKLYKIDLDEEFCIIYNAETKEIIPSGEFKLIGINNHEKNAIIIHRSDYQSSIIDDNGNFLCGWFECIENFSDGIACAQGTDGRRTFLDTKGQQICDWYLYANDFHEGYGIIERDDGKWAYVNTHGKIIDKWFDDATNFYNGLAKVGIDEKGYTIINTNFQQICDWYKNISLFYEKLARVQSFDDKWSLINTKGQRVCGWFDYIGNFQFGRASVKINNRDYYIDTQCNLYDLNTMKLVSFQNENYLSLNNLITEALHTSIRKYLLYN